MNYTQAKQGQWRPHISIFSRKTRVGGLCGRKACEENIPCQCSVYVRFHCPAVQQRKQQQQAKRKQRQKFSSFSLSHLWIVSSGMLSRTGSDFLLSEFWRIWRRSPGVCKEGDFEDGEEEALMVRRLWGGLVAAGGAAPGSGSTSSSLLSPLRGLLLSF